MTASVELRQQNSELIERNTGLKSLRSPVEVAHGRARCQQIQFKSIDLMRHVEDFAPNSNA